MKYWTRVADRTFEVEIGGNHNRTVVTVDGRQVNAELERLADGLFTLLIDDVGYDLAAIPLADGYSLSLRGVPFDVTVEDERQQRLTHAGLAKPASEGEISVRSPMPGLVVRVDVAEGDDVEIGARLLVLEAMKMENDISAPRAGRVARVRVNMGQAVEQGQLLVVLE